MEFALVIYKKSRREQKRRKHVRSKLLSKISSKADRDHSHSHEREKHKGKSLKDLRGRVQHGSGHNPAQGCCTVVKNCFDTNNINICSIVFFPMAFIVFNIWYWMYYKSKTRRKMDAAEKRESMHQLFFCCRLHSTLARPAAIFSTPPCARRRSATASGSCSAMASDRRSGGGSSRDLAYPGSPNSTGRQKEIHK